MKKIVCFCLIAAFVVTLAGCNKNENTKELSSNVSVKDAQIEGKKNGFSLLYCYADSFNPYSATSELNRKIGSLLFDSLVKTDNNLKPVYYLAQSISNKGTVCKVTLKDAKFSDGSSVTANDVKYSFNAAKNSKTKYSAQLYEVSYLTVTSSKTLAFHLNRKDPYFVNLIDFPIFKAGSEKRVNSDGVLYPPTGCGRYVLSSNRRALKANPKYYGKKGEIKTINLIDAPDSDSVSHYVEIGAADIYYNDDSDGNIVRMSGKKTDVNLTNLVYIGVNHSYGDLGSKYMRYAISSAINRAAICQGAYYNNALSATGFFSPVIKAVKPIQTISDKNENEITVENLDKIGYNRLDKHGFYENSNGNHPVYSLLVNKENQSRVMAANLISSQLKSAGIDVNVKAVSYKQYKSDLKKGRFELYLGEINILPNMDMSELVIPSGKAAYGLSNKSKKTANAKQIKEKNKEQKEDGISCKEVIRNFYKGKSSLVDVAGILLTEMPQIPVCYRKGLLFYSSDIKNKVEASQSDIYLGFEKYLLN